MLEALITNFAYLYVADRTEGQQQSLFVEQQRTHYVSV